MSLFTADQLVAHAVGDYVLQSDWMANEKTKRSLAAFVHATTYAWPFLLLSTDWRALAIIVGTHFVIDRWRLARWVVLWKNLIGGHLLDPRPLGVVLQTYESSHGSPIVRPPFLSVWLLIIVDNLMHVTINALALRWFP